MVRTRAVSENDLTGKIFDAVEVKGLSREEVLGEGGLLKQLTGRLLSRILEAEMDGHLGCEKNSNAGDNSEDRRNGRSEKTILTENRSAVIQVPRDRNGTFEPKIIPALPAKWWPEDKSGRMGYGKLDFTPLGRHC
jgi:hypothetical protein